MSLFVDPKRILHTQIEGEGEGSQPVHKKHNHAVDQAPPSQEPPGVWTFRKS